MFTADGELRPEYEDLESVPSQPQTEQTSAKASPPPLEDHKPPAAAAEGGVDPQFLELVQLLADSAAAALGLLSEPGSPRRMDLPGARRVIDWLALLERKTRNNLSFAEQNLLARVLYELRLSFVEAESSIRSPAR